MRIYYRGPDALVTDERFVWRTSAPQIVAIRELNHVRLARTDVPDPRSTAAMVAGAGMAAAAAAGFVVAGALIGTVLGALAIVTVAVSVTARQLRTVRLWQVHGAFQGIYVVLYESTDERVFNQVTRALRRAIEGCDPSPAGRDLVTA